MTTTPNGGDSAPDLVSDQPPRAAPFDFAAVARVSTKSELLAVRLKNSYTACTVDADDVPPDWSTRAFIGFRTRVSRYDSSGRFRTEAAFIVVFREGTDVQPADLNLESENQPDVFAEVTFELLYALAESAELHDGDLDEFAAANSTLHAWPYWREIAQSISARMGVQPLVVGTYKIPSAHDPDQ